MSALLSPGPTTTPTSSRAPTVVVIDDDPAVADVVARICAEQGARVEILSDGRHLRALLEAATPDGIILDVFLPDRDGLELLRDVVALSPSTSILMMSGHGDTWIRLSRSFGELLGVASITAASQPLCRETVRTFVMGLQPHQA